MNKPLTSGDSSINSNEAGDHIQGHDPTFVPDWQERRNNLTIVKSENTSQDSNNSNELQNYISTFMQTWQKRQESLTHNQAAIKKAEREWQAEQEKARQEVRSRHQSVRQSD